MKAPRLIAYAAGAGFIALGLFGLVSATDTNVTGWAVWFAGAAVAHDALLVPCVLLLGALTTRLPSSFRRHAQGTLLVAGVVTLVSLPLVLGHGRRGDNPSILPLAYGRNLLVVLGAIAVASAAWVLLSRHRKDSDGAE
ncbi:hypothetical protein ACFQ07_01920 [Actinomadura adrarensis]|uniref:Lipoprotein n=1 Tax=Actinomadura adrarensis TaxID=1819600 RepID=A0ABW3CBC7_9ACTN